MFKLGNPGTSEYGCYVDPIMASFGPDCDGSSESSFRPRVPWRSRRCGEHPAGAGGRNLLNLRILIGHWRKPHVLTKSRQWMAVIAGEVVQRILGMPDAALDSGPKFHDARQRCELSCDRHILLSLENFKNVA